MSALGQKRTSEYVRAMSALPPKADVDAANALSGYGRDDLPEQVDRRLLRYRVGQNICTRRASLEPILGVEAVLALLVYKWAKTRPGL
jgi:hypothetical protein